MLTATNEREKGEALHSEEVEEEEGKRTHSSERWVSEVNRFLVPFPYRY